MSAPFTLDGKTYNVIVPMDGIQRSFEIRDGKAAGWAKSGRRRRDPQGTYFTYTMEIDTSMLSLEEYDSFFEAISDPVESHELIVPYGQETLTFEAAVYSGGDKLRRIGSGKNLWRGLSITFESIAPQKVPIV